MNMLPRDSSPITATSPEMIAVLALAHRAAHSDAKVLITGESGVGK
jgi:DNA-binding NtrC family response regulator